MNKDFERAYELLDEFISNAKISRLGAFDNTTELSPILSDDKATVKPISKESILCRLGWNAFNPIRNDSRFQAYIKKIESWI